MPFAVASLLLAGASGCSDADVEIRSVTVEAELLGDSSPVSVAATTPTEDASFTFRHEVVVTWEGEDAFLEDARFSHHVEDGGDLVIAGRGCGASWDEDLRQVLHACTDDLQIIRVTAGDTHAYPVQVYTKVGPLRLKPGTYVVDETIGYWVTPANVEVPDYSTPSGAFTVRLTYTVR